jgi:hypothetical protein
MAVQSVNTQVFTNDPYFAGTGDPSTQTSSGRGSITDSSGTAHSVSIVLVDNLDPKKYGELLKRPGHWATITLLKSEWPTRPRSQMEVTVDSVVWRVDSFSDTGDSWECACIESQRKMR